MNQRTDQHNGIRYSRGYTLLFAVLTAALVLGVAAFIVGIARKQFILASTARESMFAIYAADSGIECGTALADGGGFSSTTGGTLSCAGHTAALAPPSVLWPVSGLSSGPGCTNGTGNCLRQWEAALSLPSNECIIVDITTGTTDPTSNDTSKHATWIDARGYNDCSGSSPNVSVVNPTVVERALRLSIGGIWY